MKRLKGPELKLPDWLQRSESKTPGVKVPPFLEDLYWDLRDRRLLPLVAVIVVAIVAVPFVFGGDAKVEPPDSNPRASISSALENADPSNLVVVEATPGLRDYRKRLAGRTPTNPFKQPASSAGPKKNGAQLPPLPGETSTSSATSEGGSGGSAGGGESGSGGGESVSTSPAPDDSSKGSKPGDGSGSDGGETAPDGGDTAKGGGDSGEVTLFTFAIDVRIARSGGKDAEAKKASKESEPVIKHRVLPQTSLPGEKAPVVTYMGMSRKGNALLLVSTDVKSVFGETKCVTGDDACQLLEAEPGFPVTFVHGYNEVHYTIKVLKIEPVRVGSL
jgi:hypothetical protein